MLIMLDEAQFLTEIEKCLADHRLSPTGFGRAATGDPTFVFELRRGRSCRYKTFKRVMDFIASLDQTNRSTGRAA